MSMCYNMQVVKIRPIGQAVKTLASHAGNSGSIPGWVTKKSRKHNVLPAFFGDPHFESEPRQAPKGLAKHAEDGKRNR